MGYGRISKPEYVLIGGEVTAAVLAILLVVSAIAYTLVWVVSLFNR